MRMETTVGILKLREGPSSLKFYFLKKNIKDLKCKVNEQNIKISLRLVVGI